MDVILSLMIGAGGLFLLGLLLQAFVKNTWFRSVVIYGALMFGLWLLDIHYDQSPIVRGVWSTAKALFPLAAIGFVVWAGAALHEWHERDE